MLGNGEAEIREPCQECGCNLWRDDGDGYRYERMTCCKCGYCSEACENTDQPATDAEASDTATLRRALDRIKVRSYELGQKELHDMALEALQR